MIQTTQAHIILMENINEDVSNKYGYQCVPIIINRRLKAFAGRCMFKRNVPYEIQISSDFMERQNWRTDVLTTLIKHEIAHMNDFKEDHGREFTLELNRMGVPFPRLADCFDDLIQRDNLKYIAICPHCLTQHKTARLPKVKRSCGECSRVFREDRLLVFKCVDNQ